MSDTHTKTTEAIDLRLKAIREVIEMLGEMVNLIGRCGPLLDRLVDEMETLVDDPEPDSEYDPSLGLETLADDKGCPSCGHCMAHEGDEHEPDCSAVEGEMIFGSAYSDPQEGS